MEMPGLLIRSVRVSFNSAEFFDRTAPVWNITDFDAVTPSDAGSKLIFLEILSILPGCKI